MNLGWRIVAIVVQLAVVGASSSQTQRGLQSKGGQIPASLPPQERKALSIEPSGQGGWVRSLESPGKLLGKADRWMSSLHHVAGHTYYLFENEAPFNFGVSNGEFAIENPRRFKIQHGIYVVRHADTLHGDLTANGALVQATTLKRHEPVQPVTHSRVPADLLSRWITENQVLVFAGLGTHDRPLSQVLETARKAGLSVKAERRTSIYAGGKYVLDRVVIARPAKRAAKLGAYSSEILLDANTGAPVTVRAFRRQGKQQVRTVWTVRWDLHPKQPFSPESFTVPVP